MSYISIYPTNYISIDPVTLVPSFACCGTPLAKTIAELITTISRWPIICLQCQKVATEVRYDGSEKLGSVATN